jgi:hypothetical protein
LPLRQGRQDPKAAWIMSDEEKVSMNNCVDVVG